MMMKMSRCRALALVALLSLSAPASALAHGLPELCVKANGDEAECGQDHTCEIFPEVSAEIGVCQEATTAYHTCDMRRGDEDCAGGQVCKIGAVDPNIGACVGDEEIYDEPSEDSGCASARRVSPLALGELGLLLGAALVAGLRRRRRR